MVKNKKYIFVTGGVLSGVGKGITAASIGVLLRAKGANLSIQKCDPYLNVDAGLLNPAEHGECFVTQDGAETDLDLGHYERFLDIELTKKSITLSGQLFSELIASERAGELRGKTVQMVPHFTNAIQNAISQAAEGGDIHITEIGGTVGDYESLSYIEAIREFAQKVGRENCLFIHVVYVPFIGTSKEFKTKPAQNALRELRSFGIVPDVVVARSENPATNTVIDKLRTFGGVHNVVLMPNVDTVYRIPLMMMENGVNEIISEFAGLDKGADLSAWKAIVDCHADDSKHPVSVGLVAKYTENEDTYISVVEALKSAAWDQKAELDIRWINAETASETDFKGVDALVVPGGFGSRGVEGKIAAARYALDNNVPYLGLCLGLQVAVIAAARKAGLDDANSTEFNPDTINNVVYIMNGQEGKESTGGTLRLGNQTAKLVENSLTAKTYGSADVVERHRHRYEVNQKFTDDINRGGLVISGTSPDGKLVEFVESPDNDYFVATQAHPEFKSRPTRPHPLFIGLIKSIKKG